jgi:hypothetical protein
MSKAKCCDRCGVFYKTTNSEMVGFCRVSKTDDFNNIKVNYDLCPDCRKSFTNWIDYKKDCYGNYTFDSSKCRDCKYVEECAEFTIKMSSSKMQ